MNLTFEGFGRDERIAEDKSQWFTPPDIAARMVRWAGAVTPDVVIEPSTGSGNLVQAAFDRWSGTRVEAFEVDPFYANALTTRFDASGRVSVVCGDYLAYRNAREPYDVLGLANPPYEDGLDGQFLAKLMDECDRIVALVRLACLAGAKRRQGVWSRLDRDWNLHGLAIFASRPEFQAGRAVGDRREGESAKADFCVVKLSRYGSMSTGVEWW